MSLFFLDEIFFLKAVVTDIMAPVPKMIQHSLNSPGAAAETRRRVIHCSEPVLSDQFQDIIKPLFISSKVHNSPSQINMNEFGGLDSKML